jgi:hypothetical protein
MRSEIVFPLVFCEISFICHKFNHRWW